MAIWQYTFHVLQKDVIDTLSSDHVFNQNDEEFNDELFWRKSPLKKSFFNKINSILIKNNSWSKDIDLYGNQDSNCFEVLFDTKGDVLSVSFRIDFRSNYESTLNDIIDFCIHNEFVILDEELNIIPLNFMQIHNIIEKSPQVQKYNKLL